MGIEDAYKAASGFSHVAGLQAVYDQGFTDGQAKAKALLDEQLALIPDDAGVQAAENEMAAGQ